MNFRAIIAAAGAVLLLALLLRNRPQPPAAAPPAETACSASPTVSAASDPLAGRPAGSSEQADAPVAPKEPTPTNLLASLEVKFDQSQPVDWERVFPYLEANRHSAESLLAAFRLTGDRSLLREALEKYPDDPHVALAAYYRMPYINKEPASEERRQWLDAFKRSDPDNALGNYLSARDLFKTGQADLAMQELAAGLGKPKLQDYIAASVQNTEEAYRAAGFSELEAKCFSSSFLPIPQLPELQQLGKDVAEVTSRYRAAGNETSAQNTLQLGLALAQQINESLGQDSIIAQFVSMGMELRFLGTLDPAASYRGDGTTVGGRLTELKQQRERLDALGDSAERTLQTMSASELISFYERRKVFGAEAALRWAAERQKGP